MHVLQHQKPHVNSPQGSSLEIASRSRPFKQDKLPVLHRLRDRSERPSDVKSRRNLSKWMGEQLSRSPMGKFINLNFE